MSIHPIKNFTPTPKDNFLFDTNIWIAACWPSNDADTRNLNEKCITFLNKCLNSNAKIYIPAVVISEFVNRIHRREFEEFKREENAKISFKQYRRCPKSKEVVSNIQNVLSSQIYRFINKGSIELIEDNFVEFDLKEAVSNLGNTDFNDSVILNICKKNNMFLVTNDSDLFKAAGEIHILTALEK